MSTEVEKIVPAYIKEAQTHVLADIKGDVDLAVVEATLLVFSEKLQKLASFRDKAAEIFITDESQVEEMASCLDAAKVVGKLRTSTDALKTAEKAGLLVKTKAIDSINRYIENGCKEIEAHFKHEATFSERMQVQRYRELGANRAQLLAPYGSSWPIFEALGEMDEAIFVAYLAQQKQEAEIREAGIKALKEAQAQAEADRIAEANRQKAEAEADRKAKAEAVADRVALAQAGDKGKMLDLAKRLEAFEFPETSTEEEAIEKMRQYLKKAADYCRTKYGN